MGDHKDAEIERLTAVIVRERKEKEAEMKHLREQAKADKDEIQRLQLSKTEVKPPQK